MSMVRFWRTITFLHVFVLTSIIFGKMESSVDETVKDPEDVVISFCPATIDLKNALNSSVENVLNSVTDDLFIKIYKDCYKGFEKLDDVDRPSLSGSSVEAKKYRKQFNALVIRGVEQTVNDTLFTTMDANLRKLEKFKQEQTDASFMWRPPGNAEKHMVPFDAISKMEEKKQLESLIEKEREAFDLLKVRLNQKRSKAKELYDKLQSSFKSIESSVVDEASKVSNSENALVQDNEEVK